MVFGAKVVFFLKTKEYFTHNLAIWRFFIWLYGLISFGHLAIFRLVIWQSFVRLFDGYSFGNL